MVNATLKLSKGLNATSDSGFQKRCVMLPTCLSGSRCALRLIKWAARTITHGSSGLAWRVFSPAWPGRINNITSRCVLPSSGSKRPAFAYDPAASCVPAALRGDETHAMLTFKSGM